MKTCGVIVEYNPFHNGHVYHVESARNKTDADCVIAVMSGNFLQRGEPSIIDKWHRTNAALQKGVDLVIELPYVFAVQHADLFAKGAILTLNALNVQFVCFGSENGEIQPFKEAYKTFKKQQDQFQSSLKAHLKLGLSFPEASRRAYENINLNSKQLDLTKPNNILGFSYLKAIYDHSASIKPVTIKRTKSNYHDEQIEHQIASATSIRKEIFTNNTLTENVKRAIPNVTLQALTSYFHKTNVYHHWEHYFPYLQHVVFTHSAAELKNIHGVEEGMENRLKHTVKKARSFEHWMELLKTKRYTWTRLQRMFVHLLTNTKKHELESIHTLTEVPYIRVLGMNDIGKLYLNSIKKEIETPIVTKLQSLQHPFLEIEERAMNSYYVAIDTERRPSVNKQDITSPIIKTSEV